MAWRICIARLRAGGRDAASVPVQDFILHRDTFYGGNVGKTGKGAGNLRIILEIQGVVCYIILVIVCQTAQWPTEVNVCT